MKFLLQPLYNLYGRILRHTKYRWVIILGTLFYLVSPLDISSDFIPFLGWIDDGIIASILVTELSSIILEKRKQAKNPEQNANQLSLDTSR